MAIQIDKGFMKMFRQFHEREHATTKTLPAHPTANQTLQDLYNRCLDKKSDISLVTLSMSIRNTLRQNVLWHKSNRSLKEKMQSANETVNLMGMNKTNGTIELLFESPPATKNQKPSFFKLYLEFDSKRKKDKVYVSKVDLALGEDIDYQPPTNKFGK